MDENWVREIEKRLTETEKRSAVDAVVTSNIEKRLDSIEDTLKWLVRLIIGAIILAAVGYALNGGFNIGT